MPKPDVSHERIPQILDAAAVLFSRRGIDGAAMNELSEATGLSKAAIYHYFPSKDSIVRSLIERLFSTDQSNLETLANDTNRSAVERLLEYVEELAKIVAATTELQPVLLESYVRGSRDHATAELIRSFFKVNQRLCEKIVYQGVAAGEFSETIDPQVATTALIAQVEGSILIANFIGERAEDSLRQNLHFLIERL